uniref:Uncharacterized protein n=1 Tax=Arundo donax TaxID=35708 RepID=A0A0A9DJW8_ARUDO
MSRSKTWTKLTAAASAASRRVRSRTRRTSPRATAPVAMPPVVESSMALGATSSVQSVAT